jgi:hypothetical protein
MGHWGVPETRACGRQQLEMRRTFGEPRTAGWAGLLRLTEPRSGADELNCVRLGGVRV